MNTMTMQRERTFPVYKNGREVGSVRASNPVNADTKARRIYGFGAYAKAH